MHHWERVGRSHSDCRHLARHLVYKWQRRGHTRKLLRLSLLRLLRARLALLDLLRRRWHPAWAKVSLQHGEVLRGLESCVEQTGQRMLVALPLPVAFDLQPCLVLAAHLDDVRVARTAVREPRLSCTTRSALLAAATCRRTASAMPEGMAGGRGARRAEEV
jgi:hypothetical protein